MFVYIVCIVWATFFVYLAERQFKKIPYDAPADRKKDNLLAKILQRINKAQTIKRTAQPAAPIEKNWTVATPKEKRHINVVLDGNDEIAIIIPNIGKNVAKPKKKSKTKHDIRKVRNIIIENNLPLNEGPASRKHASDVSKNIKADFLDEKAEVQEETQENIEKTSPKPPKRKVEAKIIMDVIAARKQVINGNEAKEKISNDVKLDNKEPRHRRMVGGEIFREKKVENIVQSARKKKPVAIVNDIVVKKRTKKASKKIKKKEASKEDGR